jgi:hypothetical protein
VGDATLNAGQLGAGAGTAKFITAIASVLCPLPLTRPIFMGDNDDDLSAIGILNR